MKNKIYLLSHWAGDVPTYKLVDINGVPERLNTADFKEFGAEVDYSHPAEPQIDTVKGFTVHFSACDGDFKKHFNRVESVLKCIDDRVGITSAGGVSFDGVVRLAGIEVRYLHSLSAPLRVSDLQDFMNR